MQIDTLDNPAESLAEIGEDLRRANLPVIFDRFTLIGADITGLDDSQIADFCSRLSPDDFEVIFPEKHTRAHQARIIEEACQKIMDLAYGGKLNKAQLAQAQKYFDEMEHIGNIIRRDLDFEEHYLELVAQIEDDIAAQNQLREQAITRKKVRDKWIKIVIGVIISLVSGVFLGLMTYGGSDSGDRNRNRYD